MSAIEDMIDCHEIEVRELRRLCKHPQISDWMNYAWASGHFSGMVRVCEVCGETMDKNFPITDWTTTSTVGAGEMVFIEV